MKLLKYSVLIFCFFAASFCCYASDNNVIVGWNDFIIANGPGTDGAFDSPEAIERMMLRWKGRGFTGVYWRIEQGECYPNSYVFFDQGVLPGTQELKAETDRAMAQFPVSQTAREKADAEGLEFWAWVPYIYSRGAPVTRITQLPSGEILANLPAGTWLFPWYGMDSYTYNHNEALFTNRARNEVCDMLSEYAYPEARASMVAQFDYFARTYGFKNFLACMRTEDYQNYYNSDGSYYLKTDKGDEFGFNQIIVDEMLAQYGVNILTDSRFDVFSQTFDINDLMVENWRVLRGNHLTQLYRDLRQAMDDIDPNIKIGVQTPGGDYVGPTIGNIKLDWRTWINEGLIDELVIPVALDNAEDTSSGSKGYLTNARTGTGLLSTSTFRNYINSSANPSAKLIYAGGPYFNFTSPPVNTDGWRTDGFTDAWYLGWYQRQQQWKEDVREFGYINYMEQNFDGFVLNDDGMGGGLGRSRYDPNLRKCEGIWSKFGDGSDSKPVIQNAIRHGSSGNAIKITSIAATADDYIWARHYGRPDRGGMYYSVDNSIYNGSSTLEFWLYRQVNSAIQAYIQYDVIGGYNVGIYVAATGAVSFSNNGTMISTSKNFGTGVWQKFTIEINLENATYSAFMGADKELPICRDVAYSMAVNTFNQIIFSPQSADGTVMYLDDVSWKWYPAKVYGDDGMSVYLADGFDLHTVDATIANTPPDSGTAMWTVSAGYSSSFFTENDLSFGNGFKCLAAKKSGTSRVYSGTASRIPLSSDYVISAQWDMWLNANSGAVVSLKKNTTSSLIAAVKADAGKWYYYDNGVYVDSGKTYDTANTIWYHLQLWLNGADKTYKLVLQPLAEKPVVIASSIAWNSSTLNTDTAVFEISPQGTEGTFTYYDNILVTCGQPDLCNGTGTTKPIGDLNGDCIVDFRDFSILSANWLDDTYWQ